MRTKFVPVTLVTSSDQQDAIMSSTFPIFSSIGTKDTPPNKFLSFRETCKYLNHNINILPEYRKYINRYFPVSEAGVESLIKFRKHNRQSIKQRNKGAVKAQAMFVRDIKQTA